MRVYNLFIAIIYCISSPSYAQLVITDNLSGTSSSYIYWKSLNGACLTAGNNTGPIPACVGLAYYGNTTQVGGVSGRLPDPVGQGALRLTNGDTTNGSNGNNQTGAVVSTQQFPTNQGVQVTFSTRTYGGNNANGTGADGLAFFLMDGGTTASPNSPSIGAFGGSLGYSCAQGKTPADGVQGAYVGIGIDEYGNFTNSGDNTASGPGFYPGYISVRGAGSVTWAYLNKTYPTYYPSNLSSASALQSVQQTCKTGFLQNYSGGSITDSNGKSISNQSSTTQAILDYPFLATKKVGVTLANQQATNMPLRANANVINYGLTITQDGFLSLSFSSNGGVATPVVSGLSITQNNGPLPASFLFGFTAGSGGGSNVHEITCFKAAQVNTSVSSAGINSQQSSKVQVGSQVYLAFYNATNWWGQLTASNLVVDATTKAVSISPTANWDANCGLTGGACASTGGTNTAQGSASRNILSWNGSAGVGLQYGNLSASQLTVMDLPTLSYLRGDRTGEVTAKPAGTLRGRQGVLGDIQNSSPTWVGAPNAPYLTAGSDLLSNTAVAEFGTAYSSYASSNATRANVVYAGANDGLLHGFRAGAYNAAGAFAPTTAAPNDGSEAIAYMPSAVVSSIHPSSNASLDFSSTLYSHNAYVDAVPGAGDLYYNGAWHTWLVGGLGAGGNVTGAIGDTTSTANGVLYALDITDPTKFVEANAASLVLGEWNSATLTCLNSATCKNSLGSVYGAPVFRRLHDGNWAVIFGNGRNSATGTAGIFIMSVNISTGAKTFRFLDTGSASLSNKNGIDQVATADLDLDHVTDYIYAGDMLGNIWRFDLTNKDPTQWSAGASPLFSAPSGSPISTKLTISAVVQPSGPPRVMVNFGTGRVMPQTQTSAATYASGSPTAQGLSGIWDWNMAGWNSVSKTPMVSLSAPQSVTLSTLQAQTITSGTGGGIGFRTVSQNAVCWKGSSTCGSGNTQFGWVIALPGTNEQVVFNPVLTLGVFLVSTTIPPTSAQLLNCNTPPASGFTMAVLPDTGAAPASSFFTPYAQSIGISASLLAGVGLSGTGTPSIVMANGSPFMVTQTTSGTGQVVKVNPVLTGVYKRITWIKLR